MSENRCIYLHDYLELFKKSDNNKDRFAYVLGLPGAKTKREAGVEIWRYCIEEILNLTPSEAFKYIDGNVVKALKLDRTWKLFGTRKRNAKDPNYEDILAKVYPEEYAYSMDKWAMDGFFRANHLKEWAHDPEQYPMPKKFFSHTGVYRGQEWCLKALSYILNTYYLGSVSLADIYKTFGDKKTGTAILKKYKLATDQKNNYRYFFKDPVCFLHSTLPFGQKNDAFYLNEVLRAQWLSDLPNKKLDDEDD